MRKLSYAQAIREGLEQAMTADHRVIVIGEGVPDPKAIFTTTAGLREKFGAKRVFDMPLSENGLTGICIGAALCGMRPIMVHQRIDFALLAMDQLINNAAKWHYMFDGLASVPLVVRMIVGRGWGQGPQHSQSLHAMFAHVPGLKVVMPTTARDAKGMLISAIEDNNPVLFIEHRWLHSICDEVSADFYQTPLDRARILKAGTDVTVAAFSYMAMESFLAATALANIGINIEVIDMRCVRPLDIKTVISSVRKTGRLVVVDTAFRTGGVAGEVIAQVTEQAFENLAAAPVRIASPDYPTPTSHFMTSNYYPDPSDIASAVLQILGTGKCIADYPGLTESLQRDSKHDVPDSRFTGPF
jgi:pyruvate/2-oxoglutarate/acetoin dehydrogenase E1 component